MQHKNARMEQGWGERKIPALRTPNVTLRTPNLDRHRAGSQSKVLGPEEAALHLNP